MFQGAISLDNWVSGSKYLHGYTISWHGQQGFRVQWQTERDGAVFDSASCSTIEEAVKAGETAAEMRTLLDFEQPGSQSDI